MPDPLTDTLQGILRLATTLPEEPSAFAGLPPSLRARAAKQLAHIFARLKTGHDISETLSELAAIAKLVSTESGDYDALSPQKRKKLSNDLEATLARLESAVKALSPIKYPQDAFDPFAPKVIGHLIADKLLEKPRVALEEAHRSKFYGAGVYALYYSGPFDSYTLITGREHPIYVGKSDPADLHAVNPKQQGHGIWQRLHDHHGNLSNVESLNIAHFDCRFLVVHSAWVTPAEDYLIEHFRPVWNKQMKICSGFGKHGDKSSTRSNKRSPWDILHPGRGWATSPQGKTAEEIKAAISAHFAKYPVTARKFRGRHT